MSKSLLSVVLVSCSLLFATVAMADITFSGSGTSGSIAPGLMWSFDETTVFRGLPVWGVPGLGDGNATWTGSGPVDDFTITFTGLTIDQTPDPNPTGVGDFTRFHLADDTPWTASFIGTDTVHFTAPDPSHWLYPGTQFFVNIAFTDQNVETVTFTGSWSEPVPEPSSLLLIGTGLIGAAGSLRRKFLP
jgi:hypothetical protein